MIKVQIIKSKEGREEKTNHDVAEFPLIELDGFDGRDLEFLDDLSTIQTHKGSKLEGHPRSILEATFRASVVSFLVPNRLQMLSHVHFLHLQSPQKECQIHFVSHKDKEKEKTDIEGSNVFETWGAFGTVDRLDPFGHL